MKVAIASEGKNVTEHFGHCEGFTIYEISKNTLLSKSFVQNPGHRPGFLPMFLKDLGVNTIIAGGMGETAQNLFRENEIEVIVGAAGLCDYLIQKYIIGELKSTCSVCSEHQHEGNCGE